MKNVTPSRTSFDVENKKIVSEYADSVWTRIVTTIPFELVKEWCIIIEKLEKTNEQPGKS